LFSCLWSPRTIVLYFFCYINETHTILCASLKKVENKEFVAIILF
jgi:hypothetical protein